MNRKIAVIVLVLLGIASLANASGGKSHGSGNVHWGYEGNLGPSFWGGLSENYLLCAKGNNQSPVNIDWAAKVELDQIEFQYTSSPVDIINNGHTIKINYAPGSFIKIAGQKYQLLQLHFHNESEHQVNGHHYPMEMHLVHQNKEGHLAVVGIFLETGDFNQYLELLWNNMPNSEGERYTSHSLSFDATSLLPANQSYFHYFGSLTTPPCSEGVKWLVLKTPIKVSKEQIARFTELYKGNLRPVQALNRRNFFASQ